uniref:Uncharacterized protein n=1 Tax=Meloidogyne enterolobii TaxID=390850 RepID=A0A6V7UU50_MELEN|nr:unnamed protein product [Meloidogyne enterolobii]
MALNKTELCSSLCSCPLLLQMQENFVKKFKVYPNQGEMVQTTSNFKDIIKALELPNKQNNVENEENEENINLLDQPEISNLWHSFDEINNYQEENEENDDEEDNIIASLDYKILNEESKTPIPVYETMTELELNLKLAKYGHGPMGKRAAIRLLNQIFEATHPIFSETTPIPRKIIKLLEKENNDGNQNNNLQRQKRTKAKIALLIELERKNRNDQENCNRIVHKNDEKQQQQGGEKTTQLKKTFLSWLRKPNNAKLYNEMLTLNPVLLEKLYTTFRQDLEDTRSVSKEALANILDEMGVTYCLKNVEEC